MKMLSRDRSIRAWVIVALLCLAGCKQAIYNDLNETEANDVLLTLTRGGVAAEKRSDEEKHYSVWVAESDMAPAIELLKADSRPAEHYATLGEIFGERRLISSPTEERVRFMYGLQQELSRTLSQIDGVLVARVHIVMPAEDAFSTTLKPASASVFLKHRADTNLQALVPAVKDLVVRSVEGLSAETVSVSLFPSQPAPVTSEPLALAHVVGIPVAAAAQTKLWVLLAVPWAIIVVLVALLAQAARVRDLFGGRRTRSADSQHAHARHVSSASPRVLSKNEIGA